MTDLSSLNNLLRSYKTIRREEDSYCKLDHLHTRNCIDRDKGIRPSDPERLLYKRRPNDPGPDMPGPSEAPRTAVVLDYVVGDEEVVHTVDSGVYVNPYSEQSKAYDDRLSNKVKGKSIHFKKIKGGTLYVCNFRTFVVQYTVYDDLPSSMKRKRFYFTRLARDKQRGERILRSEKNFQRQYSYKSTGGTTIEWPFRTLSKPAYKYGDLLSTVVGYNTHHRPSNLLGEEDDISSSLELPVPEKRAKGPRLNRIDDTLYDLAGIPYEVPSMRGSTQRMHFIS